MNRDADYSSGNGRATDAAPAASIRALTVLGIETSCDETAAAVVRLTADGALCVTQTHADDRVVITTYGLREIGSDAGRSFRLYKRTPDGCEIECVYEVHLSGNGQQSCQKTDGVCPDFEKSRGCTCKHTEMIRKLLDTGKIAGGYPDGEPGWDTRCAVDLVSAPPSGDQ